MAQSIYLVLLSGTTSVYRLRGHIVEHQILVQTETLYVKDHIHLKGALKTCCQFHFKT